MYIQVLLHVLDVRDAMDNERFVQLQFDPISTEQRAMSIPEEVNPIHSIQNKSTPSGTSFFLLSKMPLTIL